MSTNKDYTFQRKLPMPSKIAQSKLYDYIRKVEIDGLPRVRAYAEAIDSKIYELPPNQISQKLDNLRMQRSDYNDIKEMVLAEQEDWIMRRSAVIQDKAVGLLANLIDKANELATKPDADVKELSAAIATLKTIMPAFSPKTSVGPEKNSTDRKVRASKYIN